MHRVVRACLAPLAFWALACDVGAADEFGNFHGKTIRLSIGAGPGGGYDLYGRLLARHLGRHLPGNPSIVPQNVTGASSLNLTNALFNSAPRDGTAIGIVNQATPVQQYLLTSNIHYDARKFNWIGRLSSTVELGVVWHTVPVNSIQDVMHRETTMGGTGPTSSSAVMPFLLNNLAGTKFKVVTGFRGTTEMGLAMERGEVEGTSTPLESLTSNRAEWALNKKIRLLVQYTASRDAELPDVPAMAELGKTNEGREILRFFASSADIGRSIVGPPGIPEATVTIMRRAFDATLKDQLFVEEAKKLGIQLKPITGEELQGLITKVADFPIELITKAREAQHRPK
ncbi:MAG: hypothetical protein IT536_02135 [Hyphomicrobiales bacterium]|nr:hypothetical protein [Hyphomicrobiales bacterium]